MRKKKRVKRILYAYTLLCCPKCGIDLDDNNKCPTHDNITDETYLDDLASLFLPKIEKPFEKFPHNLFKTLDKHYSKEIKNN